MVTAPWDLLGPIGVAPERSGHLVVLAWGHYVRGHRYTIRMDVASWRFECECGVCDDAEVAMPVQCPCGSWLFRPVDPGVVAVESDGRVSELHGSLRCVQCSAAYESAAAVPSPGNLRGVE